MAYIILFNKKNGCKYMVKCDRKGKEMISEEQRVKEK